MTGRGEEGTTLVEVLVAVAILSTAVASIVAAMSLSVLSSDIHRKQAVAETVVRSVAEATKATLAYQPCATTYPVPAAAPKPSGYVISPATVDYLVGGAWNATCPGGTDVVQRLTLTVDSVDGRAHETLQLVVRKP